MTTSHTRIVARLVERNIGRLRDRLADAGLRSPRARTRIAIYNAMTVHTIPGADRAIEARIPATIDGVTIGRIAYAIAHTALVDALNVDVRGVGLTPHHTTGVQIYSIDELTYRMRW